MTRRYLNRLIGLSGLLSTTAYKDPYRGEGETLVNAPTAPVLKGAGKESNKQVAQYKRENRSKRK